MPGTHPPEIADVSGGWKAVIRVLLACVFLVLSATVGECRNVPPLEGLAALRAAFADVQDFTADIVQEKRLSLMKRTITMKGSMRFRKPDLFFMEIVSPYSSRTVLRDTVLEQVMAGGGEKGRIVLPPDQGLKRWFLKLQEPVVSLPEGMKINADLNGDIYSVAIMPQGKGQVRELNLVFRKDGIVKRLVITEQNGDSSTIMFRNVRKNVGLTERDFRLE